MSVRPTLVVLAALFAVAGCGGTGHGRHPQVPASPPSMTAVSEGPTACMANDLRGAVRPTDGRALQVQVTLAPGSANCILQGVPRLELLDAVGKVIPTAQTTTSLPGGNPVPLVPDGSGPEAEAHFSVQWGACAVAARRAVSLRVLLPAQGGSITLPLDSPALAGEAAPCGGNLRVGPFMPSGAGR